MPSTEYGAVREYPFIPDAGSVLPRPGDLFETTGGTGYLVASVRAARGAGDALGRMRLVLVVVDLSDPLLAGLERLEWRWLGTPKGSSYAGAS